MEKEPKERLYDKLYAEKVYTKSYAEFDKQLSAPGGQQRLYDKLYEGKIYTKTYDEFNAQLTAVKKKEESQPVSGNGSLASSPMVKVPEQQDMKTLGVQMKPNMQPPMRGTLPVKDFVDMEGEPPIVADDSMTNDNISIDSKRVDPSRPSISVSQPDKSKMANIPKIEQKPQELPKAVVGVAAENNWLTKRNELEAIEKETTAILYGPKRDDKDAIREKNNNVRRELFGEYYKNNPPSEKPDVNMNTEKARNLLYDVQNYGPKRKEKPELLIPADCPEGICVGAQSYPQRNPEYVWKAMEGTSTKPPSLAIKEDYGQWRVDEEGSETEEYKRLPILFDTKADAEDYVKAVELIHKENASRWLNKPSEDKEGYAEIEESKKKRIFYALKDQQDIPLAKKLFEAKSGDVFADTDLSVHVRGEYDVEVKGEDGELVAKFRSGDQAAQFVYDVEALGQRYKDRQKEVKKKKTGDALKLVSKTTMGF